MQHTDSIIIGSGPGGYIAAIQAARLGLSVTLVEEREPGGVCLNRGCIPTKTLIDTAKSIDAINTGKRRGIVSTGTVSVDLKTAVQFKQRVTKRLGMGVEALLRDSGVNVVKGTATVLPDLTVEISGGETLQAKKIILATGTVPLRLPIPGADDPRVLTSDDLLEMETVPDTLAILGGGVIGVEMARIFNTFGAKVHVIEALDRLCPFLDADLSQALTQTMTARKIKVATGIKLENIEPRDDKLVLHLADSSTIDASHLLLAVGRAVEDRAFASLNLRRNGQFVAVDGTMQTSHPDVYAVGDVNGLCLLAHAAYRMGEIAASHIARTLRDDASIPVPEFRTELVPGGIFSDPEIGYVGLTETQAIERFGNIRRGRLPLVANGRAVVSGHTDGFVKVIADAATERIVGVQMIGLFASELINEAATVIANGLTVSQWGHVIHAHPSIAEALPEAALDCFGRSLHLPHKSESE
jgi:dihydrolipoamide dehydrogenase